MRWTLIFAALVLSGCANQSRAPVCIGLTPMTPKPATAVYVAQNDAAFGRQVAGNNRTYGAVCK